MFPHVKDQCVLLLSIPLINKITFWFVLRVWHGLGTCFATLILIHNPPLEAQQQGLQFEQFSQFHSQLKWNVAENFTLSQPEKKGGEQPTLLLPMLPLCFKVGFSMQIGFTFKSKSFVWKAKQLSVLSRYWYFNFDAWH